jgi:hypothetical protein
MTHVECYSGSRYGERPVSFDFMGRSHSVRDVTRTWRSPSGLHFRVTTAEEKRFELTYHEETDEWSIAGLDEAEP